jgi:DNA helicase-2/ATP-dependent DNA helicase PcrA
LAYVGITRAKEISKISFAANRRMYNKWSSTLPSRFMDELPADHVEVISETSLYGSTAPNTSMFAEESGPITVQFGGGGSISKSGYQNPGWRRVQQAKRRDSVPLIEESANDPTASDFDLGERVFHQKFGYGRIKSIYGNKLTIEFEKAGRKKVIASFVERH